jgi:hypothetical protein
MTTASWAKKKLVASKRIELRNIMVAEASEGAREEEAMVSSCL